MNVKGLLSRILVYVVGLFIMAFGVSLSLKSNLGVSPVNSLPNEISLVFKSFGINLSLGNAVIIIFSCYVLVQILIKRRKFPLIDLTQVIFSVIFGYFTNFTGMITDANNYLTNLPLRLVFMAVSMVFIALGVSIYMNAKLVNMPMEGMTLAIAESLASRLHVSRLSSTARRLFWRWYFCMELRVSASAPFWQQFVLACWSDRSRNWYRLHLPSSALAVWNAKKKYRQKAA